MLSHPIPSQQDLYTENTSCMSSHPISIRIDRSQAHPARKKRLFMYVTMYVGMDRTYDKICEITRILYLTLQKVSWKRLSARILHISHGIIRTKEMRNLNLSVRPSFNSRLSERHIPFNATNPANHAMNTSISIGIGINSSSDVCWGFVNH